MAEPGEEFIHTNLNIEGNAAEIAAQMGMHFPSAGDAVFLAAGYSILNYTAKAGPQDGKSQAMLTFEGGSARWQMPGIWPGTAYVALNRTTVVSLAKMLPILLENWPEEPDTSELPPI